MKGNFQQHFKQVDAVVCCMFQFSSPLQKRRAWFYVQTKDSCNVCLWYMCRYCTSKSRRWMFFLWILHLSRGSSFTTFLFRVKYTNFISKLIPLIKRNFQKKCSRSHLFVRVVWFTLVMKGFSIVDYYLIFAQTEKNRYSFSLNACCFQTIFNMR